MQLTMKSKSEPFARATTPHGRAATNQRIDNTTTMSTTISDVDDSDEE